MFSNFNLQSLSILSVKAVSTAIVFVGIFLGYQDKVLGFSSTVVGFGLITHTANQSLRADS